MCNIQNLTQRPIAVLFASVLRLAFEVGFIHRAMCESTTVAPEDNYLWRRALKICDCCVLQPFSSG